MTFQLDPTSPPKNDDYYMGVAFAVRRKANCVGNRVAAVLVRDNRIISTGYNGVPEGMTNCLDGGCLRCKNKDKRFKSGTGYDLCICVHAEQNALLSAARFGISVKDAELYTTMKPCFGCAKELVQAQVRRVIFLHGWAPFHDDLELNREMNAEYEKIITKLSVAQLKVDDPVTSWAVSTLRHSATEDVRGVAAASDVSRKRPSPASRRRGRRNSAIPPHR